MNLIDCEIFLLVDANGDYSVGNSAATAREKYEEDIGALADCDGFRLLTLRVRVPLPEPVVLTGTAPVEGAASLSIA